MSALCIVLALLILSRSCPVYLSGNDYIVLSQSVCVIWESASAWSQLMEMRLANCSCEDMLLHQESIFVMLQLVANARDLHHALCSSSGQLPAAD